MPNDAEHAGPEPIFLDDFYAECDEHLAEVRRALVRLEDTVAEGLPGGEVWQRLMRRMHSLKGIMGMAGLPEPERLAHAAEGYLRAVSRGEISLTEAGVDTLGDVTKALEQVLAAHRQHQPLPDVASVLERTSALAPSSASAGAGPGTLPGPQAAEAQLQERLGQAQQSGKALWRACFTPSAELSRQGININSIRTRLQSLGEILHSAPQIHPGGGITFEFFLATETNPEMGARLRETGLKVEPMEPSEMATSKTGSKGSSNRPGAPAGASLSSPAYVAPSHIVRVDLSRLDELMQVMGELVVYRARLDESLVRVAHALPAAESRTLQEVSYGLSRELRRLRNGLMRVRLVPIIEVFERMSLVVRDLARESGRKIRLNLQGQETQIDKYVVERLRDPLLHLVRNAATHGLESPAERAERGKPEVLVISLRAATVGESVIIEVEDDGRGIDEALVRQRAQAVGLPAPEPLTPGDLLSLLCQPGFSTRSEADLGAGRGVGMAVVKNTLTELGGEMNVRTELGQGTTFVLRLPLTLAITDALLIGVGSERYALPQTGLKEITTVSERAIQRLEKAEFMRYREGILPLVRLAQLFGLSAAAQGEYPVLVVGHGTERVGIVAERIYGQREIMVRALSDPLCKIPAVSGATELGDGRAVLILDALGLLQAARNGRASGLGAAASTEHVVRTWRGAASDLPARIRAA